MRRLWIRSTFGPSDPSRDLTKLRRWIGIARNTRGGGRNRARFGMEDGGMVGGRGMTAKVSVISGIVSSGCLFGWSRVSVFRRQFCGRLQATRPRASTQTVFFPFLSLSLIVLIKLARGEGTLARYPPFLSLLSSQEISTRLCIFETAFRKKEERIF